MAQCWPKEPDKACKSPESRSGSQILALRLSSRNDTMTQLSRSGNMPNPHRIGLRLYCLNPIPCRFGMFVPRGLWWAIQANLGCLGLNEGYVNYLRVITINLLQRFPSIAGFLFQENTDQCREFSNYLDFLAQTCCTHTKQWTLTEMLKTYETDTGFLILSLKTYKTDTGSLILSPRVIQDSWSSVAAVQECMGPKPWKTLGYFDIFLN